MTNNDLKRAYQRTGLSYLGMTFEKAMSIPAIRISLECAIKATKRNVRPGRTTPAQLCLI